MKKCLITIVSAIFIAAVTHAQEPSENLAAEQQQLAQQKAELDAREKALDKREKMLAAKERATASSTSRSREKEKAKARHEQAIAQIHGRTSESCACRKEVTRTIFPTSGRSLSGATGHACLHATRSRTRRTRVAFRRHRSILRRSRRPIGRSMEHRSSGIRASFILIR